MPVPMRLLLELLISSQDLYRITQSENGAVVVDTRSFSEYKKGHLPGAVNVDLFQLHWFDTTIRGIKQGYYYRISE
jgi:rhodanese-related sulfurtransferase